MVALFTRAWIEMDGTKPFAEVYNVALFTRAWIEMIWAKLLLDFYPVALFTRAWIEIVVQKRKRLCSGRPLHEGVD